MNITYHPNAQGQITCFRLNAETAQDRLMLGMFEKAVSLRRLYIAGSRVCCDHLDKMPSDLMIAVVPDSNPQPPAPRPRRSGSRTRHKAK